MTFAPFRLIGLLLLLPVALGNIGASTGQSGAPEPPRVLGLAYSPYHAGQNPDTGPHPSADQLAADMALLAGATGHLRIYACSGALAPVPALAERHGMTLTAGAWLSGDPAQDEAEIACLIGSARRNPAIRRLLVGNEAILRGDLSVERLAAHMARVRQATGLPVSTAEPWHIWLEHPELGRSADFVAAHVLPYWDGVPSGKAVDYVLRRWEELRRAHPGKPVLLAEVGWPGGGPRRGAAEPDAATQAGFARTFIAAAERHGVDYFLLEAFDQPWKASREGPVGGTWGLWDAARRLKLPWSPGRSRRRPPRGVRRGPS